MKSSHRIIAALFMFLLLFATAFGQQRTPSSTQNAVPIVTATASAEGVDFVSVGRVHQTRLQVFSADGVQVFDSDFQLGNLVSWQLQDQQGSHPTDGTYLYLVTVRDFSERLTQKYGTVVLERERVYLEQPNRNELPQEQATTLEANRVAETLSTVDRVGVAAMNRTASPLPTGGTNTAGTEASSSNNSNPAAAGENLTAGTGTQNYVARWIDNAGTLGDSSIFDTNGRVGIGTTTPNINTVLHLHKSWNNGTAFLVSNDDPGSGALVTMRAGLNPNNYAVDYASLNVLSANWTPGSAGPFLKGKTVLIEGNGSNFGIGNINNTEPLIFYTTASRLERMRVAANGNVGIGTSNPTAKLDVNGDGRFTPGGSGGAIQFGAPGGTETGISISNASTRGELRFDGTSLKLVAGTAGGPPPVTNGITVNTSGNVGIGTSNPPISKLHVLTATAGLPAIYAESPNRGVWGVSTSGSYGVYGESTGGGIGVQGVSTSNIGVGGISISNFAVAGTSTSSIGVRGETASTSIASPGVQGISTGAGGVGVRGDGTTGVYGRSTSGVGVTGEANAGSGTGVYGTSISGYAMYANGNAGQAINKSGFVKAMILVNPFQPPDQYIVRCYNGLTNSSTGNCGFTVTRIDVGQYKINFGNGLTVNDRFFSLTTLDEGSIGQVEAEAIGAATNEVIVFTQNPVFDAFPSDERFFLIVY